MMGVAAVAFASCSHDFDLYNSDAAANMVVENYNQAFVQTFGQPAANQDWGFGATKGLTRAITVNGDVYEKFPSQSDVADKFPTSIPADADEVAELLDKYKGTTIQGQYGPVTMWDLFAIYANLITEGYNLKITQTGEFELGGTYKNSGWDNSVGKEVTHPFNVYVEVDGDVTIKRNGTEAYNLYILKGNVTFESNYGECGGIISVAEGATFTDKRNSIAHNTGIQLYNRGTINATDTEKYDIGNFCTVYNEGTFNVAGALTYSPGDANTSYFVNFGDDAKLTAASMTLNSSGNFYNDGTATITGETNVTQAGIYWVNAGHYTTGSMVFSAKNATFYNYCQLFVKGNAHMYDGEFNLMNGSYTEAATADFDNFIVNMESNSGFNVKGDTDWAGQGDGTYQGFRTEGSNVYVRLGGTTTVAEHMYSLELTGNITYAIKEIVDLGAGNSGVQPTYRFNDGTVAADFDNLTVTPNEEDCGATWTNEGETEEEVGDDEDNTGDNEDETEDGFKFLCRVFAEDLSASAGTDFDFNDVVFDVYTNSSKQAKIIIQAAGGTLPLRVAGYEVHALFNVSVATMVNTKAKNGESKDAVELPELVEGIASLDDVNKKIVIEVDKSGRTYTLAANPGEPAAKFAVEAQNVDWCDERQPISNTKDAQGHIIVAGKYPKFDLWVTTDEPKEWWK